MPIRMTFEIEVTNWETFKKYFLMTHPNQTADTTSPLSDDDWIKRRILLFAKGAYEKAFCLKFTELNPPPYDENIITQV